MLYTFWKHYFNYTQRYKTTCFILCANPCRWDLWIPLILVRRRWSYPTVPGGIYKSHLGSQVGFINPTRDPAWETKCHVKCGIPGGIYFLSRVGLAGSHHSWRDPAIPTRDPRWDWWDPAWLFTWVLLEGSPNIISSVGFIWASFPRISCVMYTCAMFV